MAVSVVTRFPDLQAATYDEVIASLDLDSNPPAGAILHVAGDGDDAFVISEIWQSDHSFGDFHSSLHMTALRMHGVQTDPKVEIAPLRNVWAVEMDTIERLGSVSLPATYSGSVL
jgi:hypothetical protein